MTTAADEAGTAPAPPNERVPPSTRLFVVALVALVTWLVLGAVGGSFQARLSQVQENDAAGFLPDDVESTRVNELAAEFSGADTFPALLVVESDERLTPEQLAEIQAVADGIPELPVVVGVLDDDPDRPADDPDDLTVGDFLVAEGPPGAPAVPVVPSEDGRAALALINFAAEPLGDALADGSDPIAVTVAAIRDADDALGDGLQSYVAGPAATIADLSEAFAGIDGVLLVVALTAVLVILLLVYRSPVLPIIVILSSVFALSAASIAVFWLADTDVIQLNGQAQGILFILVVGATTDYALLLTARYREELRRHDNRYQAMRTAWRRALDPIVASGATVILGLMCLLLSQLGSNRALGPVAGTGIVFAVLSALTFLPAMLLVPMAVLPLVCAMWGAIVGVLVGLIAGDPLVGAGIGALLGLLVWPVATARIVHTRRVRARAGRPVEAGRWVYWPGVPHVGSPGTETSGVWARVAAVVGRHPRRTWAFTLVALLAMAAALPLFRDDGTAQSDTFLNEVESLAGQEALARHFPAGSDSPALIIVPEEDAEAVLALLEDESGVASASPTVDQQTQQPIVLDGRVQIEAVLADPFDSTAAEDTIRTLRSDLDEVSDQALVGGQTAIQLDVQETAQDDLVRIVPAVLLVILVILVILLRSLVAPLLIVAANVVSFAATIGVAALFFNYVFRFPGSDPAILLFGFVFLVALGIDYSIFLMTRAREESIRRGTRPGLLVALAVTGGVITSAGIVLATTFVSLATLPILFLAQIAFIVAFGVLLDTFVVRSLLLPAVGYDIGRRIWWPHRLSRRDDPPGQSADDEPRAAPVPVT